MVNNVLIRLAIKDLELQEILNYAATVFVTGNLPGSFEVLRVSKGLKRATTDWR
ncbi:conserved hypothetical protein [Coccidioides posadasii str. Silveira]|uniref:Uncharacterized protein n=1 Tax=Coccidioides posadasii (strain RMSCC 757 / Silveira) TaxID=443226 RepID=E9DH59_COCPS|nr:conserved hypothetical protein [Coccidioides posadasii str. Silveira]